MNTKTAKRLRKEANYHPSQPRDYIFFNKSRKNPKSKGTVELADHDQRVLYNQLKAEYYEEK